MIEPHDRRVALGLVREAVDAGASYRRACEILDINERTARRWRRQLQVGDGFEDQRKKSGGARRVISHIIPPLISQDISQSSKANFSH
uniref:Homeodomain-like domain-containing protein n=1 Tax=Candidatus Kentrum sp. TUN TaxID=2126343 RepID=A0A451B3J8_9GAMM|nr:MAG: Homeodomain-like domain-containing protein [Candidatus Kentron sp. TUN]VFK72860.1 MAG: Homeodomain-like domain-containing protein [Candidatus Kentron sp. TUN]